MSTAARPGDETAVSDAVISVRDLSKRFKLYRDPWDRVVEGLTLGRVVRDESFWALQVIILKVRRGECIGVIGVKGAGKTTLLKILSRGRSGETRHFWYLIEGREPVEDLKGGIHFYDRRGILVYATGTASRGLVLPALRRRQRLLRCVSVTLTIQAGEYTLVPKTGDLAEGSPEPGLLHDRLELRPPIVGTRRHFDRVTRFLRHGRLREGLRLGR